MCAVRKWHSPRKPLVSSTIGWVSQTPVCSWILVCCRRMVSRLRRWPSPWHALRR
ncbi:Uncharacterised protein [Mycobacteroides abscessus subsp. abscessus]|nr:Uncharacterised protein [Mycobacteroides abscessus subsp. abscessus]